MICVTGLEPTTRALAARFARHSRHLQEVRLDALESIDDTLWSLLAGHPRLVLTCRGKAEGGRFKGKADEQKRILEKALTIGIGFVDIESSLGLETVRDLYLHRGRTRLIVSKHEFNVGSDPKALWKSLSAFPADLHKLAFAVSDAAELEKLLELPTTQTGRRLLIGMSPAGLLSRVLYSRFGSEWTYVFDGHEVAPGQLDVATAESWGIDRAQGKTPIGLLGGESVMKSPGPAVYNRLFRERGIEALYLPLLTSRPLDTLRLTRRLGFRGLSVTMPAKREILPAVHELNQIAARAGAVNTVWMNGDQIHGENSDALAFGEMLDGETGHVLLLGAGGVARGFLAAIDPSKVTIAARNPQKATALAEEFGASAVTWEHRGESTSEVVVNATPLGADGKSNPLPNGTPLKHRRVIDTVMVPGGTPLVRKAKRAGATVSDGYDLWCRQGALQMNSLLGLNLSADELRTTLREVQGE